MLVPAFILQAVPGNYLAGFTADLLQALLALLGVCALAVVALKLIAPRIANLGSGQGPVQVVQRLALEPRRALYLVRAGSRLLLIGFSEAHGPVLLAELDPQSIPAETSKASEPPTAISKWLRGLMGKP